MSQNIRRAFLFMLLLVLAAGYLIAPPAGATMNEGDEYLIVDCLLPGQIRKLGRKAVYQTARRAVRVSARECEIRGGEYVAEDQSSYASALKVWLPQAQSGDPEAQIYVGEIYEKGLGLPPDYQTAAMWYQKAADNGNSAAQINLGNLYEKGLGVPKDPQKALYWYRMASGLGDEMALVPAQEIEGLKKEAAESKMEAESLRQQLNQVQGELDRTRQELLRKKSGVELEKQKLEETRRELEQLQTQAQTQSAPAADDSEIRALQEQLSQREAELNSKNEKIAALESQASGYKEELRDISKDASAAEQAQQQAAMQEKESQELKKQLEQTQAELEKQRKDAEARKEKLDSMRVELEKRMNAEQSASGNEKRIQELEQELKKRELALGDLQTQVSELEEKEKTQNEKIASLQKSGDIDTSDPRIVLIDPEVKRTRGLKTQIETRSGTSRTIVGKVVAQNGVQSFTVNGTEEKLDGAGIFKFDQLVRQNEVPMELVAVDRKGNRTSMAFVLLPMKSGPDAPEDTGPGIDFGNFYALLIGNDDYVNPNWQDLKTPLNDVGMIDKVLREHYGFKTKVLRNATRKDILAALEGYQKDLTSKDNLVIYYAGHGQIDQENSRGFWVPVDGDYDRPVNWISTLIIADFLSTMQARHVLVVADSCYSGTLTRSALPPTNLSKDALRNIVNKKSRTALTSGDIQPVLDAGGGSYSVFAKAFIDALQANHDILTGQNLHGLVYSAVTLKVEQVPQYSPIRFAGHQAGDMLFVPVN